MAQSFASVQRQTYLVPLSRSLPWECNWRFSAYLRRVEPRRVPLYYPETDITDRCGCSLYTNSLPRRAVRILRFLDRSPNNVPLRLWSLLPSNAVVAWQCYGRPGAPSTRIPLKLQRGSKRSAATRFAARG